MLEAILLPTAGLLAGRLWAWLKASGQHVECPRCAVEDRKQDTLRELSALKQWGEEQMYWAASQRPKTGQGHGANDPVNRGERW
jgi:hypothetical protein